MRHTALVLFVLGTLSGTALAKGPTIIVRGEGVVEVIPDLAYVTVEVRSRDKDPERAQAKNVTTTKNLYAAIQKLGIKRSDFGSTNFTFKRDARSDNDGKIVELGYYAENSVQIAAKQFEDLPRIIAASIANGATSIGDIAYTVSDTKPYIEQARLKAFQDAKETAENNAKAAGMALGPITTISMGDAFVPDVSPASRAIDGEADMPAQQLQPLLTPGTVHIKYNVTIEYELK